MSVEPVAMLLKELQVCKLHWLLLNEILSQLGFAKTQLAKF